MDGGILERPTKSPEFLKLWTRYWTILLLSSGLRYVNGVNLHHIILLTNLYGEVRQLFNIKTSELELLVLS